MRLAELEPRWIEHDGQRVGFMLRCPLCRGIWLTCRLGVTPGHIEQMRALGSIGFRLDDDGYLEDSDTTVLCAPGTQWSIVGGSTFNDLSVTPSLDASASGHWHGNITAGEIVGGI